MPTLRRYLDQHFSGLPNFWTHTLLAHYRGADSCAGELVSNAEMSLGAADTSVCATSIQKAVDFGG